MFLISLLSCGNTTTSPHGGKTGWSPSYTRKVITTSPRFGRSISLRSSAKFGSVWLLDGSNRSGTNTPFFTPTNMASVHNMGPILLFFTFLTNLRKPITQHPFALSSGISGVHLTPSLADSNVSHGHALVSIPRILNGFYNWMTRGTSLFARHTNRAPHVIPTPQKNTKWATDFIRIAASNRRHPVNTHLYRCL